jgi:hypothetical protein
MVTHATGDGTAPSILIVEDDLDTAVGGNKTHAVRVLGVDRRSLYRRLARPSRCLGPKRRWQYDESRGCTLGLLPPTGAAPVGPRDQATGSPPHIAPPMYADRGERRAPGVGPVTPST